MPPGFVSFHFLGQCLLSFCWSYCCPRWLSPAPTSPQAAFGCLLHETCAILLRLLISEFPPEKGPFFFVGERRKLGTDSFDCGLRISSKIWPEVCFSSSFTWMSEDAMPNKRWDWPCTLYNLLVRRVCLLGAAWPLSFQFWWCEITYALRFLWWR